MFTIFRRVRLNLKVFDARVEGASEKCTVFCTDTAYDVIIFKSQGGLPQVAPLPGAFGYEYE